MSSESPATLRGALFDLDGTITQTAPLRKAAWKTVLDPILAEQGQRLGRRIRPFDIRKDYRDHFDGRSRPHAVQELLRSRQLERPLGSPEDGPEVESGFGLTARKQAVLSEMIEQRDLAIFDSSLALIRELHEQGVAIAVVSPSRGVEPLLERAGIRELVSVVADGETLHREGLAGKPQPDLLLAAASRLGQAPESCAVFDWSPLGMEAARAGGFALGVGVDRGGSWIALRQAGADRVVPDLEELDAAGVGRWVTGRHLVPPPAILDWPAIRETLAGRGLAVFLDAEEHWARPVVERPGLVKASEAVREGIQALASQGTLILVGERRAERLAELVDVEGVLIAGCGGLEVWSEGQILLELGDLEGLVAENGEVVRRLRDQFGEDENLVIEHRGASVLVTYRYPQPRADLDAAIGELELARRRSRGLSFELWAGAVPDRGEVLARIAEQLDFGGAPAGFVALAGDAEAEDAWNALPAGTLTLAIVEEPRSTPARYSLQGEVEIQRVLTLLAAALRGAPAN